MKKILLLSNTIFLISCLSLCEVNARNIFDIANSIELSTVLPPDSVTIQHEFANAPFDKVNDMNYFKMKMQESSKTIVELEKNLHDPSVKDTIKTIYWGKSYIQTLRNEAMEEPLLIKVVIKDNNLTLRNGLKIGKPSSDVFKYFKKVSFDAKKTYRVLCVEALIQPDDVTGSDASLVFYFKDNKLTELIYLPWFD